MSLAWPVSVIPNSPATALANPLQSPLYLSQCFSQAATTLFRVTSIIDPPELYGVTAWYLPGRRTVSNIQFPRELVTVTICGFVRFDRDLVTVVNISLERHNP